LDSFNTFLFIFSSLSYLGSYPFKTINTSGIYSSNAGAYRDERENSSSSTGDTVAIADENLAIKKAIQDLENRIDQMHLDFDKFIHGDLNRMPPWEELEQDLLAFSRKKIFDLQLSNQLDRILYKFQTRKRIWLRWLKESHTR